MICNFAYGPADNATATPSRMVLPFWCRLTEIVLEKMPLNGFSRLVAVLKCIATLPCTGFRLFIFSDKVW